MRRLTPDVAFQSSHRADNLARKSVRGGATTLSTQGVLFVLGLLGTVVLARLLTPVDFGLVAMVTVITGFIERFKTAGLGMATVQREQISRDQISTLFWLNVSISAMLTAGLLIASPLVGMLYGQPDLTSVTAVLSVSFLLSGLTIQHQAILYRHMMFGELAAIQIVSRLVTLSAAIALACLGWRYWALVAGALVGTFTSTLLTFVVFPWRPSWIRRGSGARNMLSFGGHLTVFDFAYYVSTNLDGFLIGKYLGAAPLGLYARAYQLFLAPTLQIRSPIVNVALPALSSLCGQPERYANYYYRVTSILATLITPIALCCAAEADFLIRLLLGEHWLAAIPVFRILAIAGLVHPLNGMQALVLLSMGLSFRCMCWGLFNVAVFVVAFVAGLPFGIEGVALGVAIASYAVCLGALPFCFPGTPVSAIRFVEVLLVPLVLSVFAFVVTAMVAHAWRSDTVLGGSLRMLLFFITYLTATCFRKSMRETARLLYRGMFATTQ